MSVVEAASRVEQPTAVELPKLAEGAAEVAEEDLRGALADRRQRDRPDAGSGWGRRGGRRCGLDSCVFTSDLDRAWGAVRALECGMVTINDAPAHGVGRFPFGGRKLDPGVGREGLGYSIDECTALKTVDLPS